MRVCTSTDRPLIALLLIALTGFFNSNDPLKADLPDDADGVELSWKDDNVSFEFAALCGSRPVQNAISEMLDIQSDGYGYHLSLLAEIDPLLESLQSYAARRF